MKLCKDNFIFLLILVFLPSCAEFNFDNNVLSSVDLRITIDNPISGTTLNSLNVSSVTVAGSCSQEGWAITFNNSSFGTSVCSQGAFTLNLDFSLFLDGPVELQATMHGGENDSVVSNRVLLVKNSVGPNISIINPFLGTLLNSVNQGNISLTGTCDEVGQSVTFSHGVGAITCDGTNFTGALDFTSVAEGSFNLVATISDTSGNVSNSSPVALVKDITPPSISISSPSTGSFVNSGNSNSFPVSGACSEAGQNVTFNFGSGSLLCDGSNFSGPVDFSAVPDGPINLVASISDIAGNLTNSSTVSLAKDTIAPTLTILTPIAGFELNPGNSYTVTVSGLCSENTRAVVASVGLGTLTCSSGSYSGNLDFSAEADGPLTLSLTHSDAAGNTSAPVTVNLVKNSTPPPSVPFVFRLQVSGTGRNVTLPIKPDGSLTYSYNFTVDWGDASSSVVTSFSDTDKTHTYSLDGTYTVTISGLLEGWGGFSLCDGNSPNIRQITSVIDLGDLGYTDLSNGFAGCDDLATLSGGVTSNVVNMSRMFGSVDILNPDVSGWDTSSVTDMSGMFASAALANPDVSGWDTSRVTDMGGMFGNAPLANPDVSGWNTSRVTSMVNMFGGATAANPNLSSFDYSAIGTSGLGFSNTVAMRNLINSTPISSLNYSNFLLNLDTFAIPAAVSDRNFGTVGACYLSTAAAARASLVAKGWTINDGGLCP